MIGCSRSDNTLAEGIFYFENIDPSEEHVPIALFAVQTDTVALKYIIQFLCLTFSFPGHLIFSINHDHGL